MKKPLPAIKRVKEFEVERREDAKGKLLSRRAYAPFQPRGKNYRKSTPQLVIEDRK